jgi:N-terminal domain of galactosyltransferase
LADLLGTLSPEEVVARLGDDPAFFDLRHKGFALCGFDLSRRPIPWDLLWGGNFSVRTDDFWGVGGFDDCFTAWGGEDLDLALRLYRRGLTFRIARDGWLIEWPHERTDASVKEQLFKENLESCIRRKPDPAMEIGPGMMTAGIPMFRWGYLFRELEEWSEKARDLTVAGEIAEAAASVPAGRRIAVLGCGGVLPASLAPAVVMDFDRSLLDQALADGRHAGYNSIGLRTPLDDQSVDAVIVTSRLSGLWECWHEAVAQEAQRIGKQVIRTFAAAI